MVEKMSKDRKKGISHRRLHLWMTLIIFIFSGTIIFFTFRLTRTFSRVTAAYDQYTELKSAAQELMNASDYLTEQVQRFTLNGDIIFLDNYFTEAFESKRREEAISKMAMNDDTKEALIDLQKAMDSSVKLMDQEYYAMRLVIEAKGYTEYPDVLKDIKLSEEDATLSAEDKIRRANELVLGDSYYDQKDEIRKNMQASLESIDRLSENTESAELDKLNLGIRITRVAILAQAVLIFVIMGLTSILAINPVLKAIEQIKSDEPISEKGSRELRYLANAYNKIYQKNKSSLERLNFKASHDELTGAFNRAGYDYILSKIDMENTYMMLFDLDNFKSINDTYGHETGDKILIKVVKTLKKVFRSEDCICRIGGDEFVVFFAHTGEIERKLIESKINQINAELEKTDDGLPAISICAGIVSGKSAQNTTEFFERTDKAMYESKMRGKHTFTFYE